MTSSAPKSASSSTIAPPSSWYEETRRLTLQLMAHASVTNTPGEVTCAALLRDVLAATPYFQAHPEHLRVEPIPGDTLGRANVVALVKGKGSRTVVLAGHYDVVSTANYGELEPWAFTPDLLLPRLLDDLRAHGRSEGDRRALRDLESGLFLPGRGALDMKSGLAAGIAVLRRFAAESESEDGVEGNLLFIATPDEEDRSCGMRHAALRLPALAAEWRLSLEAAINLDSSGDLTDGTQGQVLYLGSVGKLLVSVFVAGRDTHAGYPFDGINANYLVARVTSALECNADLADFAEGEAAPPPTSLKQGDLKVGYDVTTPAAAWGCYNFLTHRVASDVVLRRVGDLVRDALVKGIAHLCAQAERHAERQGRRASFTASEPLVITFRELREIVFEQGGDEARRALADLCDGLTRREGLDLPHFSRTVTEHLWRASGLTGPAAVVGFASLPYPSVHLDGANAREAAVRAMLEDELARAGSELGVTLGVREFFQGISDMSFLGRADRSELAFIAANTPPWGSGIKGELEGEATAGIPTVNLGPWGRDFHQRIERVHTAYTFGILPELVARLSRRILSP